MRKILNNYSKQNRLNGHPKGKIGLPLPITDKNNKPLFVGDFVQFYQYEGRILYSEHYEMYGCALYDRKISFDADEFDMDSYYSFCPINLDNGDKMSILKLENVEGAKVDGLYTNCYGCDRALK